MKFENQEAFILASKRVKARISRAKELKVGSLDGDGLKALAENLATAKAISDNKTVQECLRGQEFYIQTLLDSLNIPVQEQVQTEYNSAVLELSTEDEILSMLEDLQAA